MHMRPWTNSIDAIGRIESIIQVERELELTWIAGASLEIDRPPARV